MFNKHYDLSPEEWLIKEEGFHIKKQGMYESLFTLGNGYLCLRGSLEENSKGSYRGVYIAGIFNKSEAYVNELVKAPGWIDFSIWIDDRKFSTTTCKVLTHERILDMQKGILHRISRLKDPKGRIIKIETKRVIFSHQVRGAVIDVVITPENFTAEVRILSGVNGDVTNRGYFPYERSKHLNLQTMQKDENSLYLEMEARDKKTRIAIATNTIFNNHPAKYIKVGRMYGEKCAHQIFFKAEKGKKYHFTKWIAILTSREGYERQLKSATTDLLHDMSYKGLEYELAKHIKTRKLLWKTSDIKIEGDKKAQKGIRFNLYHLLICKPHHDQTVSIGAKFLTGEGYKGHAFWDTEIFILPFYIFTFPEEARNLLMYRFYTIKGALQNAEDLGYQGAKYAWESADDGKETTPDYGVREDGSQVKIFTGEEEHHIVADVVYGIHKYMEVSGDKEFLYKYGAEIVLQTARFWISRVEKRRERYEIRKVIGPDEFHEHVDNNAFTNYLARWNLEYAIEVHKEMQKEAPKLLKDLEDKIKLKHVEIENMKKIANAIFFPFNQVTKMIEQFEGYFSLDNYKISKLDKNGLPLFPKGVDESNLHRTQLVKQADVVLLLYLFLDRFTPEVKKKNYDYYEARTMHKSSLSPCIYALMGLETGDHKRAYDYFMKTSLIDLIDANKNTDDGIHAAATGGAWMTIVHGFAGMKTRNGLLCFDPWLPHKWQKINYHCVWKGTLINVVITPKNITIQIVDGDPINVTINNKSYCIKPKQPLNVKLT